VKLNIFYISFDFLFGKGDDTLYSTMFFNGLDIHTHI